jgi:hypothetical protein
MSCLKEFYQPESYTPHPEDVIYKCKSFMSELFKIEEEYMEKLYTKLNLNEKGKELLFDYMYNTLEGEYEDFEHYLMHLKLEYKDMVNGNKIQN